MAVVSRVFTQRVSYRIVWSKSETGFRSPVDLRFLIVPCSMVCKEKAMATHSSTLALKIPWTEEPGRLQSMGSLRVEHDWSDLAAAAAVWRRILKLRFRYFQLQVFTKQAISDCRLTFWFECEISIPFPKCGLILHSSFYWVLNYRH